MASKYVPIIDQLFGDYKVISDEIFYRKDSKEAYYAVECLGCNEQFLRSAFMLEKGSILRCKACGHKKRQMDKYPPLGTRFNSLTVIEGDRYRIQCTHHMIHVQCDCGNTNYVDRYNLEGNKVSHCKQCTSALNKKNHKEISGSYFCSIRNGAKSRQLAFEITIEDCWDQFQKQLGECNLSGLELILDPNWGSKISSDFIQTASLDRIDSAKGYFKDNIQWIHKDINRMKLDFDEQYFIKLCRSIFEFSTMPSKYVRTKVLNTHY